MESVGVAEAKARLSELLGRVAHRGERILVRRRGKPVAVLVPVEDVALGSQEDWLDRVIGLCADAPELCDELDRIVQERKLRKPRSRAFAWEESA
jgi:prevent-host-death family protein